MLQAPEQEIPLKPMEKTVVELVVPLQPMEDNTGAAIQPAAMLKQVGHALRGAAAYGEPTQEQSVPEGLYPMKMTHAGAVLEGLESNLRAAAVISSGGKVSTTSNPRLLKEQYGLKMKICTPLCCRKSLLASAFPL